MELALDAAYEDAISWAFIGFQSLFSWNLLLMGAGSGQFDGKEDVSILVFVELALDVAFCHIHSLLRKMVSILVFVELALDGKAHPRED